MILYLSLVIADRPCRGIEIAQTAGIKTELLSRVFGKAFDRNQYTLDTIAVLKRENIELIAMAGYMTVFAPVMFEHFKNKIINIHPSLLPLFKGDHAVRDALGAGAKKTGTTIHYATAALDDGEILAQEEVPVLLDDTVESLHERIKTVERRLYPETVLRLIS